MAAPEPQRTGLRLRTAGKPTGKLIVPQAQVVSHFFGSFVVIDIPNNLLNCLSSHSSEGRRAKAGCSSRASFIIYIIGLFCSIQSILQGSHSATSHLMCLRERKSLDCVPHPCNWKKYCQLFQCLRQGSAVSWVCCFTEVFLLHLQSVCTCYAYLSLTARILTCPIMSWKYRRAKLVCCLTSPVLVWDLGDGIGVAGIGTGLPCIAAKHRYGAR